VTTMMTMTKTLALAAGLALALGGCLAEGEQSTLDPTDGSGLSPDALNGPGEGDAETLPPDDATETDAPSPDATEPADTAGPLDVGVVDDAAQPGDTATPVDTSPGPDTATPDTSAPADAAQPTPGPNVAGPHTVGTVQATFSRGSRSISVVAHTPIGGDGPWPLVVFHPGFGLESFRYAATCERVASHGFVVVRADTRSTENFVVSHVAMADDLVAVIDWARAPDGPLAGQVDEGPVGIMGHSLGGKLAAMVTGMDDRVGALLGIDPVNGGAGPLGFTSGAPDVLPDAVAHRAIPMGFIGETTNGTGSTFAPACAPLDGNFEVFYASAAAATWRAAWDFEGASHLDFLDDTSACIVRCNACPTGDADRDEVRAWNRTLAAAFFLRHLAGRTDVDAWLVGAELPGWIAVTTGP